MKMSQRLIRWALLTAAIGGGVMALAGEWTSPLLWAFLIGVSATALYALIAIPPDLAQERFRPPTEGIDKRALRWIRITALATLIVAPLDSGRFHWSAAIPDPVRAAAIAGMIAAFLLCFHAMTVNRFFSPVIRIQTDRGHRLVDAGPYAIIRHPGYAGMILGVPLMAIALGSWLGFATAALYALLILNRVTVDTSRVRSRLLPGIW